MKKILVALLLGIVLTSLVATPAFAGGAHKYLFDSDDYSQLVTWGYTGNGAILINNAGFTVWRYHSTRGYWQTVFKTQCPDEAGWTGPHFYSEGDPSGGALPYPDEFVGVELWYKHYATDGIPKFKNATDYR